jgi:hypothetical protein
MALFLFCALASAVSIMVVVDGQQQGSSPVPQLSPAEYQKWVPEAYHQWSPKAKDVYDKFEF